MVNRRILFYKERSLKKADAILNSITLDQENQLTEKLIQVYEYYASTDEQIAESEEFLHQMSEIVKQKFPQCKLCFYGSRENGFFTKQSNLDITVMLEDEQTLSLIKQREYLKILFDCLKDWESMELKEAYSAKFPIVRFKKNNFSGVISVNNSDAMKSTNLLRFYSEFEPVVQKLGLLLKFVINKLAIDDVRKRFLCRYAYMIMLIHYLQHENILPVIQELTNDTQLVSYDEWYRKNESIIKTCRRDKSVKSLSELWIGFFKYYTMEFDLKCVVSIRKSRLSTKPRILNPFFLAIEDPLETSVNHGVQLRRYTNDLILKSFYQILLAKGDVFKLTDENDVTFCIPDSNSV